MCQFHNRIATLFRFYPSMSTMTTCPQLIPGPTFTSTDHIAILTCALQNQNFLAVLANLPNQTFAMALTNFFICYTQKINLPKMTIVLCQSTLNSIYN